MFCVFALLRKNIVSPASTSGEAGKATQGMHLGRKYLQLEQERQKSVRTMASRAFQNISHYFPQRTILHQFSNFANRAHDDVIFLLLEALTFSSHLFWTPQFASQ